MDVSAAIERQRLSAFLVRLVALSFFVVFCDGFDQNVISFAAPALSQELGLSRTMMGNVFSAGLVGSMLGGFLFGSIGDRFGRRPAMILATVLFGLFSLSVALVGSYSSLLAARFAVGIGTGGLLPVCWALNIDYVPKRFRATVVTLVMLGYSAGASMGGPVALWLIPNYGWRSVFILGGVLSLLASGALTVFLPESIRFLTTAGHDAATIGNIVRRMTPDVRLSNDVRFVLGDEDQRARRFSAALLFRGDLRWITPMLWLAYIFSSVATFFLTSWTPLVFKALEFSPAEAAAAGSITAIAGALGGLALMRFTDAYGAIAVAAMPTIAAPLLLIGGFADVGHAGFLVLIGLIAFALVGGHLGMNSIAGIFYPSMLRSTGAGWATAVGKIGSIAGPLLGGLILSTNLPTQNIFAVMAVCPALMLTCLLVIGRLHRDMLAREQHQSSAAGAKLP
jgi:AAHS family 4-hydroxybenzoate transporter-like MFS transporter